MNERIKEIWEEATVSVWPRPGKFTAGEYDYHIEKFAELIVRECASICYNSGFADPDAHAQNLLFHFNVDDCRNDK
jgi:hypothetical protein